MKTFIFSFYYVEKILVLYRAAVVTKPKSFILPLEERMFQGKVLSDDFLGEFDISAGNYSLVTNNSGQRGLSKGMAVLKLGGYNGCLTAFPPLNLCDCTNNR